MTDFNTIKAFLKIYFISDFKIFFYCVQPTLTMNPIFTATDVIYYKNLRFKHPQLFSKSYGP